MKLTFDQIRAAARGCAFTEEKDGALWLYRFTREQMEFYRHRDADFFRKAHATSGVVVEFDTDSPTLFLAVTVSTGSSRRFVAHSIFVNGVLLAHFGDTIPAECPAHDLEGSYDLGEGTKRVKILFPWASASRIRELRLASGSSFLPVKKDFTLILYGDSITESMEKAITETNRRRALQQAYNELHGITPQSVKSTMQALIRITDSMKENKPDSMSQEELESLMKRIEDQMLSAAKNLDFEKAAKLRDELFRLKGESTADIQKPQTHRRRRERTRK